jgi:hypothetical protein
MSLTNDKKCPDCKVTKARSDFYSYKGKTMAYCKACQNIRSRDYQKKTNYRKSEKAWAKDARVCLLCTGNFYPVTLWQKTCSRKCGAKLQNNKKPLRPRKSYNCMRCAKSLDGKKANAIYCSTTCCSMDYSFRKRGGTRFTTIARRNEIYQRDQMSCYICNKQLLKNNFHLDHIIPHSRGGTSEPNNLAVSCSKCNQAKGDKIGITQLLKLSQLRQESC